MSAEKELARAAWLNEADTKAVMEALGAKGGTAHCALEASMDASAAGSRQSAGVGTPIAAAIAST